MDPTQTATSVSAIQPALFWLVATLTAVCALATVLTQNIVRSATWLLFTLAGTSAIFFLLGADLVGVTQLLVYVGGTLVLVIFGVMLTAQGPFINMKTSGAEWAISVVAGMLLLAVLSTSVMSEYVELGPPLVRMESALQGQAPHLTYGTPESKLFAPALSRAEREKLAVSHARRGDAEAPGSAAKGGMKGQGGMPKGAGKKKGGPVAGRDGGKAPQVPPAKGGPVPVQGVQGAPAATGPETLAFQRRSDLAVPLDAATSPEAVVLGQGFLGVGVGPAHNTSEHRLTRTSYLLPFEIVSVHLLVVLIGAAYLARAKRRQGVVS